MLYSVGFCCKTTQIRSKCTHTSPPSGASLSPPLPSQFLGHHRALSWVPCTTELLPDSFLFYTRYCTSVSGTLSVHPTLAFPSCVHESVLYICISTPACRYAAIDGPALGSDLRLFYGPLHDPQGLPDILTDLCGASYGAKGRREKWMLQEGQGFICTVEGLEQEAERSSSPQTSAEDVVCAWLAAQSSWWAGQGRRSLFSWGLSSTIIVIIIDTPSCG